MSRYPAVAVIAVRAASKSFIVSIYCCSKGILYPQSKILISSKTVGQSKLIISEKIKNELMIYIIGYMKNSFSKTI